MADYTYTGEDARYYPTLGLVAAPGMLAELVEPPDDGRWQLGSVTPPPVPVPSAESVAHPLP